MSERPTYIASDAHLGATTPDREAFFIDWLRWAGERAGCIVLNGDLFDFWYEYRSVIPRGHTRLLGLMAEITDSGIPLHLMGGNHDWWLGDYFSGELGVTVHQEPVVLSLSGFRTLVAHGDGLGRGDLGYRALRLVLRGRLTRWAFRWLHPDLGASLARFVSKTDRRVQAPEEGWQDARSEFLEAWGREALERNPELDIVTVGHTHEPREVEVAPRRWFFNTGDWIHHHTFLTLEPGGSPQLRAWTRSGPVSLPARSRES
jgi:UDP-2,3-diacylglucosamine hydrolase